MKISSPAFEERGLIPAQYTCKGQNISPPLNIVGVPANAQGLALIMHDPDAVSGDFVHWLMWDIPAATKSIAASTVPVGALQGANSAGQNKYFGPCPPAGTGRHRYMFELYALDIALANFNKETNREQLKSAMAEHVLEESVLTGLFGA